MRAVLSLRRHQMQSMPNCRDQLSAVVATTGVTVTPCSSIRLDSLGRFVLGESTNRNVAAYFRNLNKAACKDRVAFVDFTGFRDFAIRTFVGCFLAADGAGGAGGTSNAGPSPAGVG